MLGLARSFLLGVATGGRNMVGVAALAVTARPPKSQKALWLRRVAVAASAGELVVDKLPQTPSRLETRSVVARVVVGGLAGGLLSWREGAGRVRTGVCAVLGAGGAAAGTQAGAAWRKAASDRAGDDLPGALAEDAASLALALSSARRTS